MGLPSRLASLALHFTQNPFSHSTSVSSMSREVLASFCALCYVLTKPSPMWPDIFFFQPYCDFYYILGFSVIRNNNIYTTFTKYLIQSIKWIFKFFWNFIWYYYIISYLYCHLSCFVLIFIYIFGRMLWSYYVTWSFNPLSIIVGSFFYNIGHRTMHIGLLTVPVLPPWNQI